MNILRVAHRGGNLDSKHAENSLEAFKYQICKDYCDVLELDVHLSKDNEIIVNHDETIERTHPPHSSRVDEMTSSELKHIGIPLLKEVLEACVNTNKSVLVEIKAKKFSFFSPLVLHSLEKKLVNLIETYEKKGVRCIVQSFFKEYLKNINNLSPRIECHFLAVAHVPSPCCGVSIHFGANLFQIWRRNDLATLKREGISALNIHRRFCTSSFVKAAHDVGLKVIIWTVDDAMEMKELIDMHVDGIITNVPSVLSSAIVSSSSSKKKKM